MYTQIFIKWCCEQPDRIENAIKQIIANTVSNKTFVLRPTDKEKSLSEHFNETDLNTHIIIL